MVKITIFGGPGTGTSTIGKLLATRNTLYFVSSGNIFRDMAKDYGYNLYEFTKICQNETKYDVELDDRIKKFGQENDGFVVESRLAYFTIPDSIKIKFVCDFEERIRRISQRDKISIDIAREKTIFRENSEKTRYESLYDLGKFGDDENFDFIIDTTNLSLKKIIEKIENFIFEKNK